MSEFDIRRFEEGDGPAVRQLHEVALQDAGDFAEDVPEPDLEDVPAYYLDDGSDFLVGTVNGDIVGMVAYHPIEEWILADRVFFDDLTAELTRMRVHPDQQRQGFGRQLCVELEDRARSDGYEQLVLDVSVDNDPARSFYEDFGFEYVDTEVIETPDVTFPLAIYWKSL